MVDNPRESPRCCLQYSYELHWTPTWGGGTTTYGVTCCRSQEDAWAIVVAMAERDGWTPPRWWQWWRRGDTHPPGWWYDRGGRP